MQGRLKILLICITLATFAQVNADLYLPSLPGIVAAFTSPASHAQLTVSLYMFGFSVSPLVYAPLSDGLGRRKPLIVGIIISLVGTLVCLGASSIDALIAGRFIQGLGAGACMSISRPILVDTFHGNDLSRVSSFMSLGSIVMVAGAPAIGGYIEHYFGWRMNFSFLLMYGVSLLTLVFILLPETHEARHLDHIKGAAIKRNLISLLSNYQFVASTLVIFLSYGAILAWLTISPILLQKIVGLTPIQYGWMAFVTGGAYVSFAFVNSQVVKRFGMRTMLLVGVILNFISGLWLLAFGLLGIINIWVIMIPMFFYVGACSFIFPNLIGSVMTAFKHIAGLASALLSTLQILGGAFTSAYVSFIPVKTQVPLGIILTAYAMVSLTLLWLVQLATGKTSGNNSQRELHF